MRCLGELEALRRVLGEEMSCASHVFAAHPDIALAFELARTVSSRAELKCASISVLSLDETYGRRTNGSVHWRDLSFWHYAFLTAWFLLFYLDFSVLRQFV